MAKDENDVTNVADILKSHFGIDRMMESRAERRSPLAQERREQRSVDWGNAQASENVQPNIKVIYEQVPGTASVPNESAFDNKCPSCGGTLAFDPATGKLSCSFCGREEVLQTAPAEPEKGYSLYDLQNNRGRRLQTTDKIIVCGTCGGNFITESSAISGLCPYCGSNSITVAGDATGTLEPTGVIPFKIGKEEAQNIFREWINKRRLSPKDIVKDSQITDLTGIYAPYWVFDCDTYTPYEGKFGRYTGGEDSYTQYHQSSNVCELHFRDLTFVASSRLEKDSYWKTVSRFDMSAAQKYDPNLLAGFWSESYSADGPATWQKACTKIYDRIRRKIKSIEDADVIGKINMQPQATNIRAKYILAPVWITSFDYHGKLYRVLINGQTGDIVGTWPKSYRSFWLIIAIIVIITLFYAYILVRILPYSPYSP